MLLGKLNKNNAFRSDIEDCSGDESKNGRRYDTYIKNAEMFHVIPNGRDRKTAKKGRDGLGTWVIKWKPVSTKRDSS